MEVARTIFGLGTLSYLHQAPLFLKTSQSLFPRPSLSLKPMKHNFWSSFDTLFSLHWGDYFLSVLVDDSEFDDIGREIESVMKPYVRDKLISSHNSNKDKIRLIHLLMSLGFSYYFESDIEMIPNQAFEELDMIIAKEDVLETISIMFEVFRLYQHKMSCDSLVRFKGEDGRLKESLVGDEAKSFTRNHLEFLVESTTIPPHLSSHIRDALYIDRYHNMEILVPREYISFYEQEEGHDLTLLKFAKLSFNYCHQDIPSKLPYVRDRIVETYFPTLGLYFEPRFSLERIIIAKMIIIVVSLNDVCDSYATYPEAKSLIDSLQMYYYMHPVIVRLCLIEREMKPRGRSASVQHTIDETKSLGRAYLALSKWASEGYMPTFDEYMEVGEVTGGMDGFALYNFIAMEDCDEKPLEMRKGEVVNGVNSYMNQHGVTKEEAVEELRKMARDNYKIVMEELLTITDVPRPVLVRCLNLARLFDVFCKNSNDEFTYPHGNLKDLITSIFIHPIPV
ncbi:putative lyase [Arabidopsis thaliana]